MPLHPDQFFLLIVNVFYVLKKNNWEGVWQLAQFPFREDSVEMANQSIDFLKSIEKALNELDIKALQEAQSDHDALAAMKIAQKALYKFL